MSFSPTSRDASIARRPSSQSRNRSIELLSAVVVIVGILQLFWVLSSTHFLPDPSTSIELPQIPQAPRLEPMPTPKTYVVPHHTTQVVVKPLTTPKTQMPKENQGQDDTSSQSAIPRILIFTHYKNLLEEQAQLTDEEEMVLAANVKHTIHKHQPGVSRVRFLTDKDCIESLQKVYPDLIPYFLKESEGMFKADVCRGSALYETGGLYFDVDVGLRTDIWKDLRPQTEFVTAKVHMQSNYLNHFFQAILGASPQSPIIYRYLELFHSHYNGTSVVKKGPLGVILLRRAWDQIYNSTAGSPSTELYQEVLYSKEMFPKLHPVPTWGSRRACHFVVVAKANNATNAEWQFHDVDFQIPMYSRVGGSRMCPLNDKKN